MLKKYVFTFCVYLFVFGASAQSDDITSILQEIENNNSELKTYSALKENKTLKLKAVNNLPNPEFGGYYMPFGKHEGGDYVELQVTQSIEFPTIYGARKKLLSIQQEQMDLEYQSKRQDILSLAKKQCLEVILLNKKEVIIQKSTTQAQKVFEETQELFNKEQLGILAFNKAKITWMQEQFSLQEIKVEKQNLLAHLKNMNGGNDVSLTQIFFMKSFTIATLDSIWEEKKEHDPNIKLRKQEEMIAAQQVNISKINSLPHISAGFNHQGIAGDYYLGIYGGVSIPLWSNRHKTKSAEAYQAYQLADNNTQTLEAFTTLSKQYNQYQLLLTKFSEYETTLTGLNSEELLLQAYELGEISFMEYYMEMKFYREALDTQLQIELQLSQLKAELLKHQL